MNYPCNHSGNGYETTTETFHGEYTVWVCEDCGHEVPIDARSVNSLPKGTDWL